MNSGLFSGFDDGISPFAKKLPSILLNNNTTISIPEIGEVFFNRNSLLLLGNGTNSTQNNTFLDGSSNNFTITRAGNATQGSVNPYGSNWSNYFDGTGDYLSFTGITFNGDFCAEAWIYKTVNPANYSVIFGGATSGGAGDTGNHQFTISNSGGQVLVLSGVVVIDNGAGTAVMNNQWNHVAWVRSGSSCAIFVNGVRQATGTSSTNNSICSRIGDIAGLSGYLPIGYISNARIVVGSSVYDPSQTTLTVPIAALTAITNTKLLTCQSNRFLDASSNNYTITRNGDVSVQRFNPFNTPTSYSATIFGGSGYFDGNGDYLSTPSNAAFNFGTGDYCIEAWVYLTAFGTGPAGGYTLLFSSSGVNNYWGIRPVSGNNWLQAYDGSNVFEQSAGSQFQLNAWNHIAYVKSSGNFSMYLNGTSVYSTAANTSWGATAAFNIGASPTYYSGYYFANGYICDVRVVKGSPVYTANFTPPNSPLGAITNTQLLLNFTNAGIVDNTMMNNLETLGNAQISTTQSKFNESSLYFDGTDDRLVMAASLNYAFGTDDFTIECWIYSQDVSSATQRGILQTSDTAGGLKTLYDTGVVIYQGATAPSGSGQNGGLVAIVGGTFVGASTSVINANTWYHVAVVRFSGVTTVYVNGTSIGSGTTTANLTGQNLVVGGFYNTSYLYNGYIDDLRITRGIARYLTNFTAPTTESFKVLQTDTAPRGEQLYTTAGSYTWTVPTGVTSVCVVCIGGGGNGIQFGGTVSGAGGGALAWKNNISVTPGGTVSVVVGNNGGGTSSFGTVTATGGQNGSSGSASGGTYSNADGGGNGGAGQSTFGATSFGGSAGDYNANGATGGATGRGLLGTGSTGNYGRGGNSVFSGSPTNGETGAVRIIWGTGRYYPNKAA